MAPSVAALDALGVWPACRDDAAPLRVMRIVDDTGRLWRAPEVRFEAAELGLPAFAWNIENAHLVAALWRRVAETPALVHLDAQAHAVRTDDDGVTIDLAGGGIAAVPACRRGRRPRVDLPDRCRHCAQAKKLSADRLDLRFHPHAAAPGHLDGIPHRTRPLYGGAAARPALKPRLRGRQSGGRAPCGIYRQRNSTVEIERRSHSILGKTHVEPGRGAFPLSIATATAFAANRIALVGEAAHLIPPIGAQGLNLGLRDAVTIAEIAGDMFRDGGDIGAATAAYDRRRRADVMTRTTAADLLNRSLLSEFLPVQGLRGLGLYAMDRIGPLRRAIMREGVGPRASLPALMRHTGP